MRIVLIIAAFELSFTTSFKYTSQIKYNVEFTNSNVSSILVNLHELKNNILIGNHNDIHVGYDFTIEDVTYIENLIHNILTKYKELISINPPPKIYTLINQLKEADQQTIKEIAKEVIQEIINPQQPEKLTAKERIKADAKALSKKRALNVILKNSAKNSATKTKKR